MLNGRLALFPKGNQSSIHQESCQERSEPSFDACKVYFIENRSPKVDDRAIDASLSVCCAIGPIQKEQHPYQYANVF